MGKKTSFRQNYKFTDSALVNDDTYFDFLNRLKKIALSIFEWTNLPPSMNARWIERCLYYNGSCAFLKDKTYGFINTSCASNGYINMYGIPTKLNCWSFNYQSYRTTYTGLLPGLTEKQKAQREYQEAILVMNDWDRLPTAPSLELFAYRLYEIQRTADTNVKTAKFPIMVVVDEKQRLMMENLYNQYDGNQPFIFGDKDQLNGDILKAVNTEAPIILDKLTQYKKEIWNEALEFLGVNGIPVEKKQRLITDEANANNEVTNLNLMSYLAPRLQACKEFNEKFGFTGTDKEIGVRVRSDLANIIKQELSITNDYEIKEVNNDDSRNIDRIDSIN